MAELKPCPFCGGKARHFEGDISANGVTCIKCSAKIYGYTTKGAATKAWNRRVNNE